jgi:hypothetical protein
MVYLGWGILLGMAVIYFPFPGWVRLITLVAGIVLSRLLFRWPFHGHAKVHGHALPGVHVHAAGLGKYPVLIAIIAVVFAIWAWHYARKRGLIHLAAANLNTQWATVRSVSKWGW